MWYCCIIITTGISDVSFVHLLRDGQWACIRFKRILCSCILLRSLQKNAAFFTFFCVPYKRMRCSLRSFAFFIKRTRRSLRSFAFFAFFCVLYKRMRRSLCLFTFFIKEHRILCILFGFISHTKKTNLAKKRI